MSPEGRRREEGIERLLKMAHPDFLDIIIATAEKHGLDKNQILQNAFRTTDLEKARTEQRIDMRFIL